MTEIKYQPEIDGIRAIAVISVLLYHLEYKFIPGGFVGVDVFFVISGFLITRILRRDMQNSQFSFARFYLRRIRRLAPALIAVVAVTFIVASFYLTPSHMQRFSGAVVASLLSVSNFFFWFESGYFDASAELKPLLHTWSLSVEEQFYLLWPALIFLFRKQSARAVLLLFVTLGMISLIASKWFTTADPTASFFLMPFRIHEFAIGAVLAMIPSISQQGGSTTPNLIKELACLLGLGIIAYSVLLLNNATPFPDVYALIPCLGAALLIAGCSARYCGWVLRNPVSVWIGKISYSLYLVHWPIVVMYKHITFEDVVVGKTRIALLILTVLSAIALYLLVEVRFRYGAARRPALRTSPTWIWLSVPLLLLAASTHAYTFNGWSGRFDKAVVDAIGDIEAKQLIRRKFIDGPAAVSAVSFDASPSEDLPRTNLLVMGDSHANDMFNALYLNLSEEPGLSIRRLEIDDTCLYLFTGSETDQSPSAQARCELQYQAVQLSELLDQADRIILSTRWEKSSFEHLPAFVAALQTNGAEVVVMGRTAEFKNVPSLVLKNGLTDNIKSQLAATRFTDIDALNESLHTLVTELGLSYIDKLGYLCNLSAKQCDVIDDAGKVLYTDYGHWTLEGARYFGKRMLSDERFRQSVTTGHGGS